LKERSHLYPHDSPVNTGSLQVLNIYIFQNPVCFVSHELCTAIAESAPIKRYQCPHGKSHKNKCVTCGGSKEVLIICPHAKQRSKCIGIGCNGKLPIKKMCPHNRQQNYCVDCGNRKYVYLCQHKKLKQKCLECRKSYKCCHNKQKSKCTEIHCGAKSECNIRGYTHNKIMNCTTQLLKPPRNLFFFH